MPAVAERKLSLEGFHARYDGEKPYFEYWDGEAVQKSMPTRSHALIQKILMQLLDAFGLESGAEITLKLDPAYEPIPDVIAAEDDEFSIRVRRQGWKILMIDAPMASHDAAITSFRQWWRRNRRAGHAYAQVAALHGGGEERYFVRDRRRILIWGLALPMAALAAAPFTRGISLPVLICLYGLQLVHIVRGCRKRGWASRDAWAYGFFTVISRFPALQGLLEYYWRRMRRRAMTIIEYK